MPSLEQVREGVFSLPLDLPFTVNPHIFSYLVQASDGALHVIDPGYNTDENWQSFVDALATIGCSASDVDSLIVTHTHLDHLGMAERMRRHTGAQLVMGRVEHEAMHRIGRTNAISPTAQELAEWGVPADRIPELVALAAPAHSATRPAGPLVVADALLDDGDTLDIAGRSIEAILTPGHTSGHLAFRDPAEKVLFSGDHILPTISSGIGLGAPTAINPMSDYLALIESLRVFDDREVFPAHDHQFTGLADRIDEPEQQHGRRFDQAAAALAVDPSASVWQVGSVLRWSAGWQNLKSFDLLSALAQTAQHVDRARSA